MDADQKRHSAQGKESLNVDYRILFTIDRGSQGTPYREASEILECCRDI